MHVYVSIHSNTLLRLQANRFFKKKKGGHEWTIQRHAGNIVYKTQIEDNQNIKLNTETKRLSNTPSINKPGVKPVVREG